jgi:hypothetical protein
MLPSWPEGQNKRRIGHYEHARYRFGEASKHVNNVADSSAGSLDAENPVYYSNKGAMKSRPINAECIVARRDIPPYCPPCVATPDNRLSRFHADSKSPLKVILLYRSHDRKI